MNQPSQTHHRIPLACKMRSKWLFCLFNAFLSGTDEQDFCASGNLTNLNKMPLNAMPNGTPTEYVRLMMPMRTVRSDSFVTSAI